MTAQQILTLAGTIENAVAAGKIVVEDVLAFLESKGADAAQLAANRALLVSDIASINQELAADGAASADPIGTAPSNAG